MPFASPLAAAAAPQFDLPAAFAAIRPAVAGAIRTLCRQAGRPAAGDDAVIFDALAAALPGFNPGRGSLAARVVFRARGALRGELPSHAVSMDEDGDGPILQLAGGVDPAQLLEALESAARDPAWASRQLGAGSTREVARVAGVSQRTAQRRAKRAREAAAAQAAAAQAALF